MKALNIIAFLFISLFFMNTAMACPGCVGSDGGQRDMFVVYAIMGFIGLVYIPMFLVYRLIFKNKNSHMIGRDQESTT